jgi:membrane protein YdbS with pleckstrin-like domain
MPQDLESRVFAISRPAPALFRYYVFCSLAAGPLFFIPLIPLYFRYHTMKYEFDSEGISMSWGILFRRQLTLTYARIQDIHLTSNLLERWLGLGRVQIQTASASSDAEMTIEGLHEFELVRDYLYTRMRGVKAPPAAASPSPTAHPVGEDVSAALREVAAELRAVREALKPLLERRDR